MIPKDKSPSWGWEDRTKQANNFMEKLPESVMYGYCSNSFFGRLGYIDQDRRPIMDSIKGYREFPYILYPWSNFIDYIVPMIPDKGSFVDIGCGAGDKVALVKTYRPNVSAYGIEHEPFTAMWGKALVGDEIILGDAFDQSYSQYDFIYAFWPIAEPTKMNLLVEKVMDEKHKKAKFCLVGFDDMLSKKFIVKSKLPKSWGLVKLAS